MTGWEVDIINYYLFLRVLVVKSSEISISINAYN